MCLQNGAITLYSRNLEDDYVNIENPLIYVKGDYSDDVVIGHNMDIIEHLNDYNYDVDKDTNILGTDYFFVTKDEGYRRTEIIALELVYFEYSKNARGKGPDILINELDNI